MMTEDKYAELLKFFLTEHPKDVMLVVECDDASDWGIHLLTVASGRDATTVLKDLRATADVIWPDMED